MLPSDPREDPVVAQRRLRNSLRRLRLRPDARQTQKQVAQALDCSPSKLLRIEAGQVPVATSDLIALLTQYGVTDRAEIDDLVEIARISRRSTIRDTYRDVFSKEFAEFVQYESYASVIRQYETKLVPGTLQTEDYAEAVIRAYLGSSAEERAVTRRVQARLERSAHLLHRSDGPDMSFIVDEAVIQRHVGRESGDTSLMIKQLEHLKSLNKKPSIKIHVMPFDFGIYRALRGPFELLEFEDPADADLLYLENPEGDELVHEDYDQIAPYLDMFTDLENLLTKSATSCFDELAYNVINQLENYKLKHPQDT